MTPPSTGDAGLQPRLLAVLLINWLQIPGSLHLSLGFVGFCFCFCFFTGPCGMWHLSPLPRDQTQTPCSGILTTADS